MRQDNIFPLTKEEILTEFPHVFHNNFQVRTFVGEPWNLWNDILGEYDWLRGERRKTKGYSTSAILIDKNHEKDYVEFWKFFKNGKWEFGYSFKKRENFNEILK